VTGACYLVVCLFVCNCQRVSVREHISETVCPIFASLHVTYGRGLLLHWRRCDMLCTSGFMNDVIFAHNGPYGGMSTSMKRMTTLPRTGCVMSQTTSSGTETRRVHCATGAGGGAYNAPLLCVLIVCFNFNISL